MLLQDWSACAPVAVDTTKTQPIIFRIMYLYILNIIITFCRKPHLLSNNFATEEGGDQAGVDSMDLTALLSPQSEATARWPVLAQNAPRNDVEIWKAKQIMNVRYSKFADSLADAMNFRLPPP